MNKKCPWMILTAGLIVGCSSSETPDTNPPATGTPSATGTTVQGVPPDRVNTGTGGLNSIKEETAVDPEAVPPSYPKPDEKPPYDGKPAAPSTPSDAAKDATKATEVPTKPQAKVIEQPAEPSPGISPGEPKKDEPKKDEPRKDEPKKDEPKSR